MKPLQLAHDHCANWRKDGRGCLGAVIDDDLQIRHCRPKPQCLLASPGQRCLYVEECVLPMARSIDNPVQRQQFEEAVRQYRLTARFAPTETRPCPDCGRAMEPRRRFCLACAAARRKASTRTAAAKRRSACKQLSQFPPLNIKGFQGPLDRVGMETPASSPTP